MKTPLQRRAREAPPHVIDQLVVDVISVVRKAPGQFVDHPTDDQVVCHTQVGKTFPVDVHSAKSFPYRTDLECAVIYYFFV